MSSLWFLHCSVYDSLLSQSFLSKFLTNLRQLTTPTFNFFQYGRNDCSSTYNTLERHLSTFVFGVTYSDFLFTFHFFILRTFQINTTTSIPSSISHLHFFQKYNKTKQTKVSTPFIHLLLSFLGRTLCKILCFLLIVAVLKKIILFFNCRLIRIGYMVRY